MKRKIILKTLCALLTTSLFSCATTNSFSKKGSLHGMVTDLRGEPVANYSIVNGRKKIVTATDDRGFFSLEIGNTGRKDFSGFKQNWESVKFDFSEVPVNRLYIIQIKNSNDLKNEFEEFLRQENYYQAEKTLSKCGGGAIKDSELALYKSLLAYKKGNFVEAKNLLALTNESPEISDYKKLLESKIQETNSEKGEK